MRKRKKIDSSTVFLSSIILVFTIIAFLSLPVLFNYKSIQSDIENKFFSDFKINLKILDDISFRVLPRPHFLIKKANLDFNSEDENSAIVEVENLKLFIPTNKIYSKKDVVITDIMFQDLNLNLKLRDLKDIRNHLNYKINKPIVISNIKLFLEDDENNIILISPIKKVNYRINESFTSKEFKLNGSIFDIEFKSNWKKNLNLPSTSINEINLNNPDIYIKNIFNYKNQNEFNGSSSIDFLNENISFDYNFKHSEIKVNSLEKKNNQKIKLDTIIELNPFYLDGNIIFEEKKIDLFTDYILNSILNVDKKFIENVNGNLGLILSNLDSKLISNGKIIFSINEGKIKAAKSSFEMYKIGTIKSDFNYAIKEGELFFESQNTLSIKNQKELSRKFQLNFKKVKNINNIYFDFERNIDTGDMFLSNIYFNDKNSKNLLEEIVKINNMLILKSTLRDILP
tara:strand:- start:1434 stop:2801 length:1368 start_codon:yes stop_codon:yes gene_type:complete